MHSHQIGVILAPHSDESYLFPKQNRMIQDAYLILAMNAVREHAKARNESFVMGVFTEQSNICNLIITAKNQSLSSALAAGAPFCEQRSFITAKIYNNIVEQIEHMGMPLSNGGAGEGVRLLLGSDITGIAAVLVSDTSNVDKQVWPRWMCEDVCVCVCICAYVDTTRQQRKTRSRP